MNRQIEKVLKYYEATYPDYKNLWTNDENLAIHFGYYDESARTHSKALLRLNEILAQYGQISAKDTVLDAGCGYGGSAIWLARKIGCKVTGITVVPSQILIGQRKINQLNLADKVELLNRDFSNTSFPNESFSAYWAVESLVHASERDKVLGEAYRLLKKGGRIVIAEYTYREVPPLSDAERQYMQPWLQGWAMPVLLTPDAYKQSLEKAGFKQVAHCDISRNIAPSLKRLKFMSRLALPGATLLGALGIFSKERVANVRGSLVQTKAFDKGFWDYSVLTATKF